MKGIRKILKNQQGQALVELALVLPVLLMILMGIIEFGRVFGASMVLNSLSREAARYGVVGYDDLQIHALVTERRTWLDDEKLVVVISPVNGERDKGDPLQVQIDYSLDLITPIVGDILPNPVPLSAQCIMRME
ncbi:MAG: TadE family protein [Bacillota bacterium]|nr:TadE family protein [Bacillota bacterium]